jgi:hypothetical protein
MTMFSVCIASWRNTPNSDRGRDESLTLNAPGSILIMQATSSLGNFMVGTVVTVCSLVSLQYFDSEMDKRLDDAVASGNVPEVQRLLALAASIHAQKKSLVLVAIEKACALGQDEIVKCLVEQYVADVQAHVKQAKTTPNTYWSDVYTMHTAKDVVWSAATQTRGMFSAIGSRSARIQPLPKPIYTFQFRERLVATIISASRVRYVVC